MKITVINGSEKHEGTYQLKEAFLEAFSGGEKIREFYLPRDCPAFCISCRTCIRKEEELCKDASFIAPIEEALLKADLCVFTSPVCAHHCTGAMKVLLDHLEYRWIFHRPAKEMFGKRAVILCQGPGSARAAKDIRDSLSCWGISRVKVLSFCLSEGALWEELSEKQREAMAESVRRASLALLREDWEKPARTSLFVRLRFFRARHLLLRKEKEGPNPDCLYWRERGWLGKNRPWKEV